MRTPKQSALVVLAALAGFASAPRHLAAQIPDEFTNLRVLDPDITRDSLLEVMRGFSFSLGVRCQYCHVGGDGVSFEGVEFDNDDDPDKRKARFMLRMVANLNDNVFPLIPERDTPSRAIQCKTCHRGRAKPELLTQHLELVLNEKGADSAVARYRLLRERSGMSGTYDFGEWEMNTLAERLTRDERPRDAIAIYKVNLEFFPTSIAILGRLGQLHEGEGDIEAAIGYYEKVLEINPNQRGAAERLAELRGQE
jgi:tetratricopeptide (TPR) repeat protein